MRLLYYLRLRLSFELLLIILKTATPEKLPCVDVAQEREREREAFKAIFLDRRCLPTLARYS
jgi:hypothetical protein